MGRAVRTRATSCATRPAAGPLAIRAGEYARSRDRSTRRTIASRSTRPTGERVTYDPRRLHGVTLYREAERAFARGDRVQFTAPVPGATRRESRTRHARAHRRERPAARAARFRPDGGVHAGRVSASRLRLRRDQPQQPGQTADRVLVHVDTAAPGEQLVNRRLGVRRRLSRPVRRADLHQRQDPARGGPEPRRVAPIGDRASRGPGITRQEMEPSAVASADGAAGDDRAVEASQSLDGVKATRRGV